MNIWYFSVNPNISLHNTQYAPSIHINETISSLRGLGHQVHAFSFADDLRRTAVRSQGGTKTVRRSSRLRQWVGPLLRDLYELYRDKFRDSIAIEPIFRCNQIDLVYERLFSSRSAVSRCAEAYRVPFIVESNAPVEERKTYWGSPLLHFVDQVERGILQRADVVTVVSTPLKRYYEKKGVAAHKIVVLPNGVNEELFSPAKVSGDIRRELGIEDRIVVGFVGNIRPYHGVELLLPLAQHLQSIGDQLHFLIVDGGQGRHDLEAMMVRENLAHLFSFVGPVHHEEVPDYIAAMDICLLPRFMWYGSPIKIFEYGAMGKTIVAPDLENIREVLSHGETAYLFEPGSIPALTQAIRELALDPQLRSRLGCAVRDHILANHTWTKNAERIMSIYQAIISQQLPIDALGYYRDVGKAL
jgi:glycosyltransferase involved in cell wall biosynthesis